MSKHLQKMCLETKFQPVRLRNDRDIERATWRAKEQLGLPVTVSLFVIHTVDEIYAATLTVKMIYFYCMSPFSILIMIHFRKLSYDDSLVQQSINFHVTQCFPTVMANLYRFQIFLEIKELI